MPTGLRVFYVRDIYWKIARKYALKKYPGSIILFQTKTNTAQDMRIWHEIVSGDVTFYTIDTDRHIDLIKNPEIHRSWILKFNEYLNRS